MIDYKIKLDSIVARQSIENGYYLKFNIIKNLMEFRNYAKWKIRTVLLVFLNLFFFLPTINNISFWNYDQIPVRIGKSSWRSFLTRDSFSLFFFFFFTRTSRNHFVRTFHKDDVSPRLIVCPKSSMESESRSFSCFLYFFG